MRLLATMKRFPAGVMVIPLLLGCTMNTCFPDALAIGGFTTGLFKNGVPTLIGLFLFCSGATIDVKMAGATVWKLSLIHICPADTCCQNHNGENRTGYPFPCLPAGFPAL